VVLAQLMVDGCQHIQQLQPAPAAPAQSNKPWHEAATDIEKPTNNSRANSAHSSL
jgi:hypothetical protein